MKVIHIDDVPKEGWSGPATGVTHFYPKQSNRPQTKGEGDIHPESSWIGPTSQQHLVSRHLGSNGTCMHLVNFTKGARTKFHTHNKEQTIIAYAGVGVQATEHGVNTIRPGDVVYIPAGEKHYHGAAKDSDFSQISVFAEDHDSQWLE